MSESINLIPIERIERPILFIRGEKVMLDIDLATIAQTDLLDRKHQVPVSADELHGREGP